MVDKSDLPKNFTGKDGVNSTFTRRLNEYAPNLIPDSKPFNAAKHAATSAIYADYYGQFASEVLGLGVETFQDAYGLFKNSSVYDDKKDLMNNAIGRAIQAAYPDKTAREYYEAAGYLAEQGLLIEDEPIFVGNINVVQEKLIEMRDAAISDALGALKEKGSPFASHCFAVGTMIQMADGSQKGIETIRPGDMVASFDETADGGRGALIGRRVVRTFVNENQSVIDFHGTSVTPGHAYLCGDGPHAGRFRQIMNIVRDDGAVVLADGSLMRAATGCAVGSPGDAFVEVQIARPARHRETGESVTLLKERGRVRAGTRVRKLDGSFVSFLDLVEANGWTLHADGLVGQGPGHAPEPLLWAGPSIPKPEDYILVLSQLTLADLYGDPQQAERPGLPLSHRQGQGEANAVVRHAAPFREDAEPGANDGSARTLVRRARNLLAAKRPRPHRVPKQAGETVH